MQPDEEELLEEELDEELDELLEEELDELVEEVLEIGTSQVMFSDVHIFSSSQHFGSPFTQVGIDIESIPMQVGTKP